MTIVSAGEYLVVDTTWRGSATGSIISGSVLFNGPNGPVYMAGVFTVGGATVVDGVIEVDSGAAAVGTT